MTNCVIINKNTEEVFCGFLHVGLVAGQDPVATFYETTQDTFKAQVFAHENLAQECLDDLNSLYPDSGRDLVIGLVSLRLHRREV